MLDTMHRQHNTVMHVYLCRYVELLDQLAHNEHFLKIQGRTQPDSKEESDRCGMFVFAQNSFCNIMLPS